MFGFCSCEHFYPQSFNLHKIFSSSHLHFRPHHDFRMEWCYGQWHPFDFLPLNFLDLHRYQWNDSRVTHSFLCIKCVCHHKPCDNMEHAIFSEEWLPLSFYQREQSTSRSEGEEERLLNIFTIRYEVEQVACLEVPIIAFVWLVSQCFPVFSSFLPSISAYVCVCVRMWIVFALVPIHHLRGNWIRSRLSPLIDLLPVANFFSPFKRLMENDPNLTWCSPLWRESRQHLFNEM